MITDQLREQIEERLESAEDCIEETRSNLTREAPKQAIEALDRVMAEGTRVRELIPGG